MHAISPSTHRTYWQEIRTLLGRDVRALVWIACAFATISALEVLGLGMIGPFIRIVAGGGRDAVPSWLWWASEDSPVRGSGLLALGALMICLFAAKAALSILLNFVVIRFCQQQEVRIRSELMSSYLSMPFEQLQRRNAPELIQTVTQLTGLFVGGVLLPGLRAFGDALIAVVLLAALAWADPGALGILLVGAVTLLFAYDRWFRRRLRELGSQQNESMNAIIRGVSESFDGFRETRVFGRQAEFYEATMRDVRSYADAMTRMQVVASAPRYLLETAMVTFVLAVSLLAMVRGETGDQALATVGVFGFAAARLLPSANYLAVNIVQLRYYRDTVRRLCRDYDDATVAWGAAGAASARAPEAFSTIEFRDVAYSYPGADRPALRDINLRVSRGECIGLVGPSGSGKSTVANILAGLVAPTSGVVLVDGVACDPLKGGWHGLVAYLPQSPFLFEGSVQENIALSRRNDSIDRARLLRAMHGARLQSLVDRLPSGVEAKIGARGSSISGGEAQRLVLARALYFDRPVIIFDESTSAMDQQLEQEVVDQIQGVRGTRTIFVIAHRAAALRHCDRIFRLTDGRLTEVGTDEMTAIRSRHRSSRP